MAVTIVGTSSSCSSRWKIEDEFVVDLEEHPGLVSAVAEEVLRRRSWRVLIMSAAVPWMGVLMAVRSALPRTVALAELMSRR